MLEFTARKNLKLRLTDHQTHILFGSLLGDAYIHPLGKIQFEHSFNQFSYLNWKYNKFRSLAYGPPSMVERYDSRYQKIYVSSRFWLRQFFRPLRDIFYPDGKKIIPKEFAKHFNDLSLAVLYMDDGNLYKNKNVKIATDGFDNKSRALFQSFLYKKFGIKSKVQSSGKIRISNESIDQFFHLVKPYIHSSMKYKIP